MTTAYGSTLQSGEHDVDVLKADEVVEWLEWLRSWNRDQAAAEG